VTDQSPEKTFSFPGFRATEKKFSLIIANYKQDSKGFNESKIIKINSSKQKSNHEYSYSRQNYCIQTTGSAYSDAVMWINKLSIMQLKLIT